MTNLENLLANKLPNLDCFVAPREAGAMCAEFKSISATFRNLASYCEATENAMQCRLDGKIALAIKFEDAAQHVYGQLPEWARW